MWLDFKNSGQRVNLPLRPFIKFDFSKFRPIFVTYNVQNMKHLARLLSLIILVSTGIFFTNCGGDGGGDGKSKKEVQYDKLEGTWVVTSVDGPAGHDWQADFVDGTINLTVESFSENGPYTYNFTVVDDVTGPWEPTGEWAFGSDPTTDMVRYDSDDTELDMNYTVTDNQLTISFQDYSGDGWFIGGSGRMMSVDGDWEFVFTKQQ